MTQIDKVLEAARRVERARAELRAAEAELLATRGDPAPGKPPQKQGPSVSQRVLKLVIDSGQAGVARKEIVAAIGKAREIAIHSALKVHQTRGRISNRDGRWVARKGDA